MWITREIDAPAGEAWALLTEVARWPAWGPSVHRVDLDGGGTAIRLGSTGRVRTMVGPALAFVVDAFTDADPVERSWSWRIAGVPATGHRVEDLGAGRCRVGFRVPTVVAPYGLVCQLALARIDHLLTRG
jgi:hypothetical protein